MAKLELFITLLVCLAIFNPINCQINSQFCPRFLCEGWAPLQNITAPNQVPTSILNSQLSQFRTGLNPNSQICFQTNTSTNVNSQGAVTQYFMHTCPYPNYFCGISLVPPSSTGGAAVAQSTATCQLMNQTNLLNVGDWCYSNSDCFSGLCDNRNQGASSTTNGYTTNTAWATQLGLNVEWSNPFQQGQYFAQQNQFNTMMTQVPFFANAGTNKCFVRKYNESCSNHQQCGLGLRCATNPWQQSSSSNNEPQYVCLPQLNQGSACTSAGFISTQSNINLISWELCPYGTACVRSGSTQPSGTGGYVCTTKFTIQNQYYFQFPSDYSAYTYFDFQIHNFQLPQLPNAPVGAAQPFEMCSSNVTQTPTVAAGTQITFQCQNPFQSTLWQSYPCQNPAQCACTDQTLCPLYPQLQQSCTCAIWNTNGSAFCKGYSGNQGGANGQTAWSDVLSQIVKAYQNYSSMASNPSCYNYQLFDQMPSITRWLFPSTSDLCKMAMPTFGNPSPNAQRPSCLEGIFHNPMFVAPQAPWELDMMEQFYGNGSFIWQNKKDNSNIEGFGQALIGWIPNSINQQKVPGNPNLLTKQSNPALSSNWQNGQCPQFICQNVTTTSTPSGATQSTFSSIANFFPIMRGACMLYDFNLNQWSMRVCRSTLDICVPCLPNKCGGYANYSFNSQGQASGVNLATFAHKCLRSDGTKKRVFEDCWDDSDCMSQFCQYPGYCAVRSVGQPCFTDVNCDRNLRCVFNPTFGTASTCQPAIVANGYCDQNSWQQCKFGSVCLLVTGEFYPRCVNQYSLPGLATFTFIGVDLGTTTTARHGSMCSSGHYSRNPLTPKYYVNYTGCLITPPQTYGGWPKQCFQQSDCNSITLVQLQNQVVNALSNSSNSVTNGNCTCDNPQSAPFWMGNTQGQMFCQGFDGERNNLQLTLRQSYERDFQNCYPYEVLDATLTNLGYLGGFCGQQKINWYDPAPNRPIGSCYAQWLSDIDILSRSSAFTAWIQQSGYSPVNSFLYTLFQRCPVYTCQNTTIQAPYISSAKNSVCRYFNVTTNQIQLNACPAGQPCNEFNSTYWICGWNPALGKNLTQTCTFDVECVSQFCDPILNICSTKALGEACYDPVQCGKGLICTTNATLYQGTTAQVLLNNTNTGTQCLTPGPVNTVCFNSQQGINNGTLCPYGTKCVLTSLEVNSQNWRCVPFYSLGPSVSNYTSYIKNNNLFLENNAGSNIIVSILQPQTMEQSDLNMMCQTGFYFQDPTQTYTNNLNAQQNGYCSYNKLWNSITGKPTYQQSCMSNQDCVNNFNYTIAAANIQQSGQAWLSTNQWYYKGNANTLIPTYGTCSCSFINDQGTGWCMPQPSDQQELPGWTQFYAQGFGGCYPFEYLTGLNLQQPTSSPCYIKTFTGIQASVYADYTSGLATQNAFNTCIKQVYPSITMNSGYNLQILPQFGYQYPTNFTTFCPAQQCLNGTTNPQSICIQLTPKNVYNFQKCTNPWETCQLYNTTLALCFNSQYQKNQGDNCMFNWQCRSNICNNNGTCDVATLNQTCTFHYNCAKNLRCSIPSVLTANVYLGKQCVTAIANGGNCSPWSFDQCKMGSSCVLQNGQSQPVCTNWYSLQGGAIFSLITNYSQYNNSQYHPSMQSTFNQMCASGLYDPVQGCKALPEITQGGWPKACQVDSDCNGARYGTPGVCACDNPNTQGSGYCTGFQDEMNNLTSTLAKNFQRPFTNCYPYEINTYNITATGGYADCGRYDFGVWKSAPASAFGSCYTSVGLPYYSQGASSLVTVNFILALTFVLLMLFK